MISSASMLPVVDVAEVAASPATPVSSGTPFDAVLALESLAATCEALDTAGVDATLLEGVSEDDTDVDDTGDDEEDALEGPLGFLAAWLPPMAPATSSAHPAPVSDAAGDAGGEIAAPPGRAGFDLPAALGGPITDTANDVSPEKLLALAGQEATAVDGLTTARDGTVDPAAPLARASELFTVARHPAGPERAGIATSLRDPRWAEEFGARMVMMVRGGESQASLQLSPVELGPLDVSVTVRDSQASIHFGAASAETRALIEASIPRLREMLAAQGFNLADASVSHGFQRQAQEGSSGGGSRAVAESESEASVSRVTPAGLLDLYA